MATSSDTSRREFDSTGMQMFEDWRANWLCVHQNHCKPTTNQVSRVAITHLTRLCVHVHVVARRAIAVSILAAESQNSACRSRPIGQVDGKTSRLKAKSSNLRVIRMQKYQSDCVVARSLGRSFGWGELILFPSQHLFRVVVVVLVVVYVSLRDSMCDCEVRRGSLRLRCKSLCPVDARARCCECAPRASQLDISHQTFGLQLQQTAASDRRHRDSRRAG